MVSAPPQSPRSDEIQALFDRIAPIYDDMNEVLSFGLHRIWKRMAVLWSEAQSGDSCLDVCCGSGDLAKLLARQVGPTGQVVGLDFSAQQLAVARQRPTSRQDAPIEWVQGDALQLPFEDSRFDAVTMGYGLRNLTDLSQGLAELRRVLKPEAKAAILDFHRPQSALIGQFQQWYLNQVVIPAADRQGLRADYAYLVPSLERFPLGAEQVERARQVGFADAVHYPIAGGLMGVLVVTR